MQEIGVYLRDLKRRARCRMCSILRPQTGYRLKARDINFVYSTTCYIIFGHAYPKRTNRITDQSD